MRSKVAAVVLAAVLALALVLPVLARGFDIQSPTPSDGARDRDGIPMRVAPPPSLWDRVRARLVPAIFYGEVVSSDAGEARYELTCSTTTSFVLRSLFLDFKRYEGKRVVVRGYLRGADGRSKPVLWAVRVAPLE